jgi:K+-transporting ATPase ATPase A chain
VSPDSSFNTAISFMTNTNWQGYGGESTMSYLTQMAALGVQNFLSAATGMVVVIALIRAFARHTAQTVGNFWVDMTRSILYILLPISLVFAIVLVSQGVVQTFSPYHTVPLVGSAAQGRKGQPGHRESHAKRAGDCRRSGRFANCDQAARHQRRRLLQR